MEDDKLQNKDLPEKVVSETDEGQDEPVEEISKETSEKVSSAKKMPSGIALLGKLSIKTYLAIIFSLIAIILVIIFAFHKNFRVNEIHVSGNQRISTEAILEASGVEKNDHLLSHVSGSWKEKIKFQDGEARQRIIDSDPYIADAQVYPRYPGEIYIDITERRKVAYVALPDGYAILSDDSVVLDIASGDVPEGIPEIRGLPILSAQIGEKIEMTSTDGYDICVTILGAILGADSTDGTPHEDFDFLSTVISIRYCNNMTTFVDISVPNSTKVLTVKIGSLTTITDDMNWLKYAVVSGYFNDNEGTLFDMTGREYILR